MHITANRAAPESDFALRGEPCSINFMTICMVHAFADGNCYMPFAQDLFTLYDAARSGKRLSLPNLPDSFDTLERRLFSTFRGDFSPLRSSLRGAMFRYYGNGYGYTFDFEPGAVDVLKLLSTRYRIPVDVILLGLVVCCMARADKSNTVDFTLYAPMRDGAAEIGMLGLFADWRDMTVGVDADMATVLGTMVHLLHTIQQRRWSPFNALRKPESCIVNIQPLDMEPRSHFTHLGENLWHGGDCLDMPPAVRPREMEKGRQPLTFNIEQQDDTTWWIMMDIGNNERGPAWTRHFITAMREFFSDMISDPLARVHRPNHDVEWETWLHWEQTRK